MTDESEIIKMDHPEFGPVRGVIKDGKMLFFVTDLCQRLWVRDRSEAVSQVSEEDIKTIHIDTDGEVRSAQAVNEYGAYALASRAKNDRTPEFMRWLFDEVQRIMSAEAEAHEPTPASQAVATRVVVAGPVPRSVPITPNFPVVYPLAPASAPVKTMSSLEIAELTGKRHDHVMRDIKAVLEQAGISAPKFGGTYLDSQNKERPCYHLPRRECDLLISGYSVPYRLAIIDRWMQLEAESHPVPRSFEEALRPSHHLADVELIGTKDRVIDGMKIQVQAACPISERWPDGDAPSGEPPFGWRSSTVEASIAARIGATRSFNRGMSPEPVAGPAATECRPALGPGVATGSPG
jgi:hypothetical protein